MILIYTLMNKISKYNDFLLEKEFNSIINDFLRIVEDVEGKWTSPTTIEWDYSNEPKEEPEEENDKDELTDAIIDFGEKALNKLRDFLKKLPKEKIKEYYVMMVNKFKSLPDTLRRKLIAGVTGVFLTFVSLTYLLTPSAGSTSHVFRGGLSDNQTEEIIQITKDKKVKTRASFEKAQGLVKLAEAGYSDDRGDNGNFIDVPRGGKRFIGTNHGISAPILAKYFKDQGVTRLLNKEDMMKLSYKTALKIYKADYWDAQHLSELSDQNVANVIYDGCVNQGTDAMRSILRDALEENGVEISDNDVIFSKEVLTKANTIDPVELFNSIKKFREVRYKESETFGRHGEGWLNRLDAISYLPQETFQDKV
jgi:lysozyme family protein